MTQRALVALGLTFGSIFGAATWLAAQQPATPAPPTVSADTQAAAQQAAPAAPEKLHLLVGRSLVVNSPTRIKRVSVADPNIVETVVVNPNQILVNGKVPGGVSLVLWDENDQSQMFDVFVDLDITGFSQKIHEAFPQESVRLEASKEAVMISGRPSSKEVADRILQVASGAAPKVINLMELPSKPTRGEVLLEVKFAEVNRSALDQFGVNLFSTGTNGFGPRSTVAATGTQQFGPPALNSLETASDGLLSSTEFRVSDLLNLFVFRADVNLGATIRALQQKNLLQILAEPNLLAQTGKEASFLAGGEFPFPVVQGGAAGTVPTVTIQFKEFGVRLNFTPELTEEGRIHLKVKPEVSSLDFTNALTVSGFFIPALSTRRVEAEMELQDGQSFAIAGLVDDRLTQIANKIPGLGDIPILGQLFRSRTTNKSKTELLIVVTPHIVKQPAPGVTLPAPQFPKPFMPPAAAEQPKPEVKK